MSEKRCPLHVVSYTTRRFLFSAEWCVWYTSGYKTKQDVRRLASLGTMAKRHPDLIFCHKQSGVAIARLCEKCDGKCVICDSSVCPCTLVCICDECNYGSYQGRCVICGGPGVSGAYYCKECTIQ
uniref:PHD finger-like domain-containing protein 5A n=1 Tax=Callithrix jacchus TaxID=9483 RepID=A0A8I3WUQ7_CALJA